MHTHKRTLSVALVLALLLTAFSLPVLAEEAAYSLAFDNTAWSYNAEDDVYWQVGVVYCTTPATIQYESLGIYVPAAYMDAVDNGDGTYTCTINEGAAVNGYTASTAPIVMPVNTAGYSAQAAPSGYSGGISSYIDSGFIYVYAGCRGRNNGYDTDGSLLYDGGAPWGATDLKAAIRYLRYNDESLPGDTGRIFTFGHSGGGAQSAVVGATGDSELYMPYLASIGAAMEDADGNALSDAIYGAMCWCPITSLDYADEAYEWNLGQYADTGTRADDTWTSALSDDLSAAFAAYINELGLTGKDGTILLLEQSESGIYAAGTYYDYLLSEIERSLNNFLSDTVFPYTSGGNSFMADGGFPGSEGMQQREMTGGSMPTGDFPESDLPTGDAPTGGAPGGRGGMGGQGSEAVTYETAQDYIDSLNSDAVWVAYDAETNTATISSVEAFVTHCKNASKSVGAFDDLNRTQAENYVFGTAESDALHFDATLADLLSENQEAYAAYADWDAAYVQAYQEDLTLLDTLGTSSAIRQDMYNPMYYAWPAYEGYGESTVAAHWRIHSGITQGDTALTVEMNLALALSQHEGVEDVEFEMVWNQGHTMAERTGNSTENFISWVEESCPQ